MCIRDRVYGTGFNEDGFQVSPFGLTNISTGESTAIESIGGESEDFDAAPTTVFESLTVGTLQVTEINPTGPVLANPEAFLPFATTQQAGIARLATLADMDAATPGLIVDPSQMIIYRGERPPVNPRRGDVWVDVNGFPQTFIWTGVDWWKPGEVLRLPSGFDSYAASFAIRAIDPTQPVTLTANPSGHDPARCLIDWGDGTVTTGISGSHQFTVMPGGPEMVYTVQFIMKPGVTTIFDGGGSWPTLTNGNWIRIGPFSTGFKCNQYFWGGPFVQEIDFRLGGGG